MKVLAVGDIHTKIWILDAVFDIIDEYDLLVFVGDYADDWKATPQDTINTWKTLKFMQEAYPEKVILVTGNHDYIYVKNTPSTASGYNQITQHLINMPENREVRDWLEKLPIVKFVDGVAYSHAGLVDTYHHEDELRVSKMWQNDSPLWVRPQDYIEYKQIPQVFGHTPSPTCWEVDKNIWCIDTFSTYQDGTPIGDETVLEIENGNKFTKRKIKNGNNTSNSIKERVS